MEDLQTQLKNLALERPVFKNTMLNELVEKIDNMVEQITGNLAQDTENTFTDIEESQFSDEEIQKDIDAIIWRK